MTQVVGREAVYILVSTKFYITSRTRKMRLSLNANRLAPRVSAIPRATEGDGGYDSPILDPFCSSLSCSFSSKQLDASMFESNPRLET
jgi:hypothetical protein